MSRRSFCLLAAPALRGAECSSVQLIEPEGEGRRWWPRWRGPSGQGVVEDGAYPDVWSDAKHVRWKVEVPGRGHSSPIVWRDRIFLTTAEDGPRRSVLCFQRRDGKLLWRTDAPAAPGEKLYWKNSYASGTPVTDGERVYAYFGSGGVMAVDFEGRAVWHRSFGMVTLYHGSGGSPLLYRDRVVVYQDQREGSYIAALHRATGAVIWKTPRQEKVGWGTPVAVRACGRDQVIVSSQDRVTAYDPADGRLVWWARGNTFETTPTPVVGHGFIFCSSGRAGPTLAIRPGGAGDVTDTHIAWQSPRGSPFIPSPLVYGPHLYLINDMSAIATCLDARTGKAVWQGRLGEAQREGFSSSPIGVNGKVFFTNDQGETFVLAAGNEFRLLHVNRFGEKVLASPALVEGVWYWRTEKHLYAIAS